MTDRIGPTKNKVFVFNIMKRNHKKKKKKFDIKEKS